MSRNFVFGLVDDPEPDYDDDDEWLDEDEDPDDWYDEADEEDE